MSANLDTRLDRCLDARRRGGSLATYLTDAPADERRDVESLVRLASNLLTAPRPTLPATTSAYQERRLLARAGQLRSGAEARRAAARPAWTLPLVSLGFLTNWRLGLVPAATVFLLVVSLVLAGGATALVSNAGPDDTLYTWKLNWEQTQLALTANDAQRARVFIGIAQSRIREIERLARLGQPVPEDLLLQVRIYVNQTILLSTNLSSADAIPILRQLSELLAYERVLLSRFLATLPEPDRATVQLALATIEESEQTVTLTLESRVQESLPTAPAPTAEPSPTASAADLLGDVEPEVELAVSVPESIFARPRWAPPMAAMFASPAADDAGPVLAEPGHNAPDQEGDGVEDRGNSVHHDSASGASHSMRTDDERVALRRERREEHERTESTRHPEEKPTATSATGSTSRLPKASEQPAKPKAEDEGESPSGHSGPGSGSVRKPSPEVNVDRPGQGQGGPHRPVNEGPAHDGDDDDDGQDDVAAPVDGHHGDGSGSSNSGPGGSSGQSDPKKDNSGQGSGQGSGRKDDQEERLEKKEERREERLEKKEERQEKKQDKREKDDKDDD